MHSSVSIILSLAARVAVPIHAATIYFIGRLGASRMTLMFRGGQCSVSTREALRQLIPTLATTYDWE